MDAVDRPEFEKQFAVFCAAFDVPCTPDRVEAYWKSLERMPLITFARSVEHLLAHEDWTRIPKPSQVWGVSKRMRAQAPTEKFDDGFAGDSWDAAANRHLLAYVLRRGAERCYYDAETTKVLVAWKNSWATDMREWCGPPSREEQEKNFCGCMERAEEQIKRLEKIAV